MKPCGPRAAGTNAGRAGDGIGCGGKNVHRDEGSTSWTEFFETRAGRNRTIKGRVLNMSTSGVLLEALRPIAIGSQVRIQSNELLVGTAYVRHSTRRSWRFRIGLEFATPVRNRY
jgi:hypothetical protein